MRKNQGACLVCGKPLKYYETEREMTCVGCGKVFLSNASCTDGHYICDSCHVGRGVDIIQACCQSSASKNPIEIVQEMMDSPLIHMHGPEHHTMAGAALITAYRNAGGEVDLERALAEMRARGGKCPGGTCGFWGCCGAAVSAGMFWSIVTSTTPLSGKTWGEGNRLTGRALDRIGALGGPRCCKRNTFTAIRTAVEFVREHLGIEMELPERILCRYRGENDQCIGRACPYFASREELDRRLDAGSAGV